MHVPSRRKLVYLHLMVRPRGMMPIASPRYLHLRPCTLGYCTTVVFLLVCGPLGCVSDAWPSSNHRVPCLQMRYSSGLQQAALHALVRLGAIHVQGIVFTMDAVRMYVCCVPSNTCSAGFKGLDCGAFRSGLGPSSREAKRGLPEDASTEPLGRCIRQKDNVIPDDLKVVSASAVSAGPSQADMQGQHTDYLAATV
jgi:hypothetical protein